MNNNASRLWDVTSQTINPHNYQMRFWCVFMRVVRCFALAKITALSENNHISFEHISCTLHAVCVRKNAVFADLVSWILRVWLFPCWCFFPTKWRPPDFCPKHFCVAWNLGCSCPHKFAMWPTTKGKSEKRTGPHFLQHYFVLHEGNNLCRGKELRVFTSEQKNFVCSPLSRNSGTFVCHQCGLWGWSRTSPENVHGFFLLLHLPSGQFGLWIYRLCRRLATVSFLGKARKCRESASRGRKDLSYTCHASDEPTPRKDGLALQAGGQMCRCSLVHPSLAG